jgi:hypothetical protein
MQLQNPILVEKQIFMPTHQKPQIEPQPKKSGRCSDPMAGHNEFGRKDCNPKHRKSTSRTMPKLLHRF